MARLTRLVLEEGWTPEDAAHRLLDVVHDPAVLRMMAAQVRGAHHERASEVTASAVHTLELAVADRNGSGRRRLAPAAAVAV